MTSCRQSLKRKSLVPYAINSILAEYFAKESPSVNVIHYGNKDEHSQIIISEISRNKIETISIRVLKSGTVNSEENHLNAPSLRIFDSPHNFRENAKNIKWFNKVKRPKLLVLLPNGNFKDITETVQDGLLIDNVNFLMRETEKSIELISSFMFTPRKSRSNQLLTINRFQRATMTWESSNFYSKKYENFHNCHLRVAMRERGRDRISMQIIEVLLHTQNFQRENVALKKAEVATRNYDLSEVTASYDGDQEHTTSVVLIFERATFLVPPGELYTPLEKMFLMFNIEVWIAIIITFIVGAIAIQVINFSSVRIQNFVYGQNCKSPSLNLAMIFLNGTLHVLPRRNFARFLLMLFII